MSARGMAIAIALLAAGLAIGVADPVLAASSDIGKNIGDEVQSWAKGLLLAVAALVGLPALLRRDVSQGLVIVLMVILIGGFVYATTPVKDMIATMWNTAAGVEEAEK